ncbi:acyl carrier protein [Frankia sp. Cr1]|uniref:acyl carrier protein n=1 Tax=Frankia sp. Cr1 TaxID=3073931 RepID=UPI002AD4AF86|nr:acyl carrier protein [Frankia sp. Cr1]
MIAPTPAVTALRALPRSERRAALEAMVTAEFKVTLLMAEQDDLPLDQNYFDLGLTSLRVIDVKQRLEATLGCEIDTSALLRSPTVRHLIDLLTQEALLELFAVPGGQEKPVEQPAATAGHKPLVDDLLKDLYGI